MSNARLISNEQIQIALSIVAGLSITVLSACAQDSSKPPHSTLSPRMRQGQSKPGDTTQTPAGTPTPTPTSTTTPAAADNKPGTQDATKPAAGAASATEDKSCRITESSKLNTDQAKEPICGGFWVDSLNGDSFAALKSLVGLENSVDAKEFDKTIKEEYTLGDKDAQGKSRVTLTYQSTATSSLGEKTEDGKTPSFVQLAFVLADPTANVDMTTLQITFNGTKIDLETDSNRDADMIYRTTDADGKTTINLIVGSPTVLTSINYRVGITYLQK